MHLFDTSRPGTFLTLGNRVAPAYLVGSGACCYWQDRAGRWRKGSAQWFTPDAPTN